MLRLIISKPQSSDCNVMLHKHASGHTIKKHCIRLDMQSRFRREAMYASEGYYNVCYVQGFLIMAHCIDQMSCEEVSSVMFAMGFLSKLTPLISSIKTSS